jgi:hypothetical protein
MVVHDFEPAMARHHEVDCSGNLGLVGQVASGVRGVLSELGVDGAAKIVLEVGEDLVGTGPDKVLGGRLADVIGGARDHSNHWELEAVE